MRSLRRLLLLTALPALLTACVAQNQRMPGDNLPVIRGAATEAQARRICGVPPGRMPLPQQELCMRDQMFGGVDRWD